jgi:hypothetical protein
MALRFNPPPLPSPTASGGTGGADRQGTQSRGAAYRTAAAAAAAWAVLCQPAAAVTRGASVPPHTCHTSMHFTLRRALAPADSDLQIHPHALARSRDEWQRVACRGERGAERKAEGQRAAALAARPGQSRAVPVTSSALPAPTAHHVLSACFMGGRGGVRAAGGRDPSIALQLQPHYSTRPRPAHTLIYRGVFAAEAAATRRARQFCRCCFVSRGGGSCCSHRRRN